MALQCENIIRQAIHRHMTDTEILDFAAEGEKLAGRVKAAGTAARQAPHIRKLLENYNRRKQAAVAAHKRAVELQQARIHANLNHIMTKFSGMEWEGISALQIGSKFVRDGARYSVDSVRASLSGYYLGNLLNDLEEIGPATFELLRKGKLDREIARALWEIDTGNYNGPKEALDIAKAIHKWGEAARVDENNAGVWIPKLAGYIIRQSHDQAKIRAAGFGKWKAAIEERLDWSRTANGAFDPDVDRAAADNFLHEVYLGFTTGIHESFSPGGKRPKKDPLAATTTIGQTAAKANHQRVLHFKSGEDWFDYNKLFGTGTLLEGVFRGLSKSANDTALMRIFGPSPQACMENMITELAQVYRGKNDFVSVDKLNAMKRQLNNQMKELDGSLNIEGNPTFAGVARVVRAIKSMGGLGAALISGFSDIPLVAQEFAYQGIPFFRAMSRGLRSFAQGRGSLEERRVLAACGVFFDSMCGNLTSRFSGQELPGKMTAMMNTFFKLNGLSLWTDSWKKSACLGMAFDLAQERGLAWDALTPKRQRVLSLYDIDAGKWEMLRKGKMKAADGNEYFTPELAEQVSRADIEAYMQAKGMAYNDELIDEFREGLAANLRAYFRDRVQYAVLEPDARTGAIFHQGLATGTVAGEMIRFATQFKSFPTVFLQRTMAREIYGHGADSLGAGLKQALVPRNGEFTGLMGMVVMTTIFGYLSMTTKHLLAGKEPRDFTESPEAFGKTFMAALVQGGGLGIVGDFLFGEKSRMGDDFLSTIAGPALGSASSLVSIYKAARDGEDFGSTAARALISHLPGNNLFWLRPVLNHMFLYSFYEYMNPGSTARLRRRIRKETGQEYWLEPTIQDWAR